MPESLMPAAIYLALLAATMAAGRLLAGPLAGVQGHSRLERLLLYWLLGLIVLSWVGTILAAMGQLRWWLVLALVLVLTAWTARQSRRRRQAQAAEPAPSRTPWPAVLLILVVLSGAGWLFARPAESYMLTDDSSVYTIAGIVLARDGTLTFEPALFYDYDDLAATGSYWDPTAVHPESIWLSRKDYLRQFGEVEMAGVFSRHYGPFFQWTLARQTLEIGFLPLPKVWIAFATWLFGPSRATWSVPFLGLTAMAGLYGLIRRTLGWPSALGTVLLLVTSLPQIWFSRVPMSEAPTQALLMAGLYLAVLARKQPPGSPLARRLAIWSALSFASLTLVRFEGLLVLALLASLLLLLWRRAGVPPEVTHAWLGTLAVGSVCGFIVSIAVTPYYFFTRAVALLGPTTVRVIIPLLAAAVVLGIVSYRLRQKEPARLRSIMDRIGHYVPLAVAGAWFLWGIIALVLLIARPWGSSLAGWLVQYWTRPGLLLSVVGALALLGYVYRARQGAEMAAFLGLAVVELLGFTINPVVTPVHPWAMRRLVPVVIPGLVIGASSLVAMGREYISLIDHRARPALELALRLLPVVFVGALTFATSQRSYPLLYHQERQGLWRGLTTFAQRLPQDAVLLFDDTTISRILTPPMELLFGHPSFVLQDTEAVESNAPVTDRLITQALAHQRAVFLVITEGTQRDLLSGWQLASRGSSSLDTTTLGMSWGRLPWASDIVQQSLPLDIYEVLPKAQETEGRALTEALDLPIGPGSYPYLRDGFYPWEKDQRGEIMRWTQAEATITMPWPEQGPAAPITVCLSLDLSSWRGSADPLYLEVQVEEDKVFAGTLASTPERQDLVIALAAVENANRPEMEILLATNTWNPKTASDQRELGFMLYGVEIAPAEQCHRK